MCIGPKVNEPRTEVAYSAALRLCYIGTDDVTLSVTASLQNGATLP